ncbi:hypothetical protein BT69DRAFT_203828 [Atractiella rhizophila]|nr:hypothetical protein BT69DRAFT_203828 [Atractiella rhizophila]
MFGHQVACWPLRIQPNLLCGLPFSCGHVQCLIASLGFFPSVDCPFTDLSQFSSVPLPSFPNSSILDSLIAHRDNSFSSIAYQTLLVWSNFLSS